MFQGMWIKVESFAKSVLSVEGSISDDSAVAICFQNANVLEYIMLAESGYLI